MGAADAFDAQHGVMEVRSDDWKVSHGGATRPLPLALVEVGRDGEQGSISAVPMYRKRNPSAPETKLRRLSEKLAKRSIFASEITPIDGKEAPETNLNGRIDF